MTTDAASTPQHTGVGTMSTASLPTARLTGADWTVAAGTTDIGCVCIMRTVAFGMIFGSGDTLMRAVSFFGAAFTASGSRSAGGTDGVIDGEGVIPLGGPGGFGAKGEAPGAGGGRSIPVVPGAAGRRTPVEPGAAGRSGDVAAGGVWPGTGRAGIGFNACVAPTPGGRNDAAGALGGFGASGMTAAGTAGTEGGVGGTWGGGVEMAVVGGVGAGGTKRGASAGAIGTGCTASVFPGRLMRTVSRLPGAGGGMGPLAAGRGGNVIRTVSFLGSFRSAMVF